MLKQSNFEKRASLRKKAFFNIAVKAKNELADIQKNKKDPSYLKTKAVLALEEINEKGRKLGIPQAEGQATKLVKRNRWSFSQVAGATKTLVTQGPTVMLEEAGFKLGNKLEKRAVGTLILLGLFAVNFLIFCFVESLLRQLGLGLFQNFNFSLPKKNDEGWQPLLEPSYIKEAKESLVEFHLKADQPTSWMRVEKIDELLELAAMAYDTPSDTVPYGGYTKRDLSKPYEELHEWYDNRFSEGGLGLDYEVRELFKQKRKLSRQ